MLVGWVLWHINLCRLFNAKSIFMKIVLFQTIQYRLVGFYGISTFVGYLKPNPFLSKSVLFHTIQFRTSTQFKYEYSLIVKNISISSHSAQSSRANSAQHKYRPYPHTTKRQNSSTPNKSV